jgi:hypothetical protein
VSRRIALLILGALVLLPARGEAQIPRTSVAGTLLLTRLDREVVPLSGNPSNENFTGVALGLQGTVPLWVFELDVRYLNGKLNSKNPDVDLDLVEAEVLLGLRPLPWIVLKAGPHARAFQTVQSTERWLFWEIRARAEAGLLAPRLGTYLEFWGALVGNVNFGPSFGSGRGAEAGLTYHFGTVPLWGRIGYRVDRGSVSGGAIFDSVQQVLIGFGYGR